MVVLACLLVQLSLWLVASRADVKVKVTQYAGPTECEYPAGQGNVIQYVMYN